MVKKDGPAATPGRSDVTASPDRIGATTRALATAAVVSVLFLSPSQGAWGHPGGRHTIARAFTAGMTAAQIYARPTSGPAASQVRLKGTGFPTFPHPCWRGLYFIDARGRSAFLEYLPIVDSWRRRERIPAQAAPGAGNLTVEDAIGPFGHCTHLVQMASASFLVTMYAYFTATEKVVASGPPRISKGSTLQTDAFPMQVRPTSGPAGTEVRARGEGFFTFLRCTRRLYFVDAAGKRTFLGDLPIADSWRARAEIPPGAAPGAGELTVEDTLREPPFRCTEPAAVASAAFTVTHPSTGRRSR